MVLLFVDLDSKLATELEKSLVGTDLAAVHAISIDDAKRDLDAGGVSFVVMNKELGSQNGLQLAEILKGTSTLREIPYIITSSIWTEKEFFAHQKGKYGANAYLKKPYTVKALISLIEAITGIDLSNVNAKSGATLLINKDELSAVTSGTSAMKNTSTSVSSGNFQNSMKGETLSALTSPPPLPPIDPEQGNFLNDGEKSLAFVVPGGHAPQPPVINNSTDDKSGGIEIPEDVGELDFLSHDMMIENSRANVAAVDVGAEKADNLAAPSELTMPNMTKLDTPARGLEKPIPFNGSSNSEFSLGGDSGFPVDIDTSKNSNFENIEMAYSSGNEFEVGYKAKAIIAESSITSEEVVEMTEGQFDEKVANAPASNKEEISISMNKQFDSSIRDTSEMTTLKKYLKIKESDVAALTEQLNYAREALEKAGNEIELLKLKNAELTHDSLSFKSKIEYSLNDKIKMEKMFRAEVDDLQFDIRNKNEKIVILENQIKDHDEKMVSLKNRVKLDLRKIKVREKELENKIEMLKRDAETLVASRDTKILELKRQIDGLEFDLENIEDQMNKAKFESQSKEEIIKKVFKMLKMTMGMIESDASAAGRGISKNMNANTSTSNVSASSNDDGAEGSGENESLQKLKVA